MKKNAVILIVVILLAGLAVYQNKSAREQATAQGTEPANPTSAQLKEAGGAEGGSRKNYEAPGFSLTALDGKVYTVGGKRDKPLMINFWASWCGPCEMEAPELQRMYAKYKDKLDLYAVNLTKADNLENAKKFAKQYNFEFLVLMDKEGKVGELYHIVGIPTSMLIGKDGVVVETFNLLEPEALEKKLRAFLKNQENAG